ncbi:uncharacterized protein LOC142355603 [Convolutriloba macropyga]|uniref:uncharacterized protein LOC142355603 n=1 Tax=Convolutriloba macropyga TaxID=536237 RepID=UPI003F5244F9
MTDPITAMPKYPLSAKDLINPTDSIKMKIFSFLATSLSFFAYGALVLSVFSEYWLFTFESTVQTINGNETRITQVVHSGLWKFCYKRDGARNDIKVNISSLPWQVDGDLCVEVKLSGPLQRSSSTMGAIRKQHYHPF